MFDLSLSKRSHDKDGCCKAFFLEGWLTSFSWRTEKQLYEQELCIKKLERRIKELEKLVEKDGLHIERG